MILNRVNIISKKDGSPLSVMYYEIPDPKGIVQIVHGMCEHKERYKEFIHYLGKQGYMVIIHDHRGHGLSVKKKRDLGYFGNRLFLLGEPHKIKPAIVFSYFCK